MTQMTKLSKKEIKIKVPKGIHITVYKIIFITLCKSLLKYLKYICLVMMHDIFNQFLHYVVK